MYVIKIRQKVTKNGKSVYKTNYKNTYVLFFFNQKSKKTLDVIICIQ